jgi:glycosyltransferase involved in cell wall biosynthesis
VSAGNPDITVVVPTYDRAELLRLSLPALAEQRRDRFSYEVLFVDDGSRDSTGSLLAEAAERWPGLFRHVALPHSGSPAAPRNAGVASARGRVVLLLDDDVVPERDLLLEHWSFHERHPAEDAAATGRLELPPEVARDPMSLFHAFPYDELARGEPLGFLFYWSCNFSAKASFLRRHGRFDEDPALHPMEDMEWGYRLARTGMRLVYLPTARGSHLHKMKAEWVEAKGRRTGRAQFALTLKVPDRAVKERFGILSADLPLRLFVWRTLRRSAFRLVDNPVTRGVLRALGANRSERSRITDAYHYLTFRRSMVAGYRAARREHLDGRRDPVRAAVGGEGAR